MATNSENGRGAGFYIEIVLVAIAILAVLAWLIALIWVAVTGGPQL